MKTYKFSCLAVQSHIGKRLVNVYTIKMKTQYKNNARDKMIRAKCTR